MEFIPDGATVNRTRYKRYLVAYAIQYVISVLSFGVGRIGCCYAITTLHIARSLCKRNFRGHRIATPSVLT